MKIKKIISEEIQNLIEEYDNANLYGYHCTPCENIESIKTNGFKIGDRQMQGKGIYGFYNLTDDSGGNAAMGYGIRHLGQNFCIVKFKIKYPNWLLILIKDIAEDVLGNDADIIKQIENQFNDWNTYFNELNLKPEYKTEEYSQQLKYKIKKDFNLDNDKELMFGTPNLEYLNKFGVIHNGEYGIQYLIKAPSNIIPIGYHNVSRDNDGRFILSDLKEI